MGRKVLLVVHQEHSDPGRVGEVLVQRGCTLERRCPNLGDPLPDAGLEGYAAAFVFGGPMSANDDRELPGIRAELDWLERAVDGATPLIGICLGAQLIARALGARVGPHPEGLVEIGYYEVTPTVGGAPYFDGVTSFYQWHAETFTLPEGAVKLAGSATFEQQAFHYGRAVYGLEFHPEMTRAMVERWGTSERGAPKLGLPGARPYDAHLAGFDRHAPASDAWLERFIDERVLRPGGEQALATAAE